MTLTCTFCFALAFVLCVSFSSAKNFTLVKLLDASSRGAVCLDGSPPGYYFRAGSGDGANKWIVHLGGGGWCASEADCYNRSKTVLGTSTLWLPSVAIGGFLSDNMTVNPKFANWNIVYVMYCDGASFAGSVMKPISYKNTRLYFRGQEVLLANLDDLMAKGMKSATDVILTGCSAGGLATYLHADYVRNYLPESINYHAMADAGYFLDIKTVNGIYAFREGVQNIIKLHNMTGERAGNADCLKSYSAETWKCFFAPYTFDFIKSPIFVLNSLVDRAQLSGLYKLPCLPPNCTNTEMGEFYEFVTEFITQALPAIESNKTSLFLDSCLIHCQTLTDEPWMKYAVNGVLMRDAFAAWYFNGEVVKAVDEDVWPDNPSCGKAIRQKQVLEF